MKNQLEEQPLDLLENCQILLVDDDADNRQLIMGLMRKMAPKAFLFLAKDGKQALNIVQKKAVDLILLDWEMPEMNGLEVLKYLRANKGYNDIGVIMYTGTMTATTDLQLALEFGAQDFLRKPAEPIELLARMRSILLQKHWERERLKASQTLIEFQEKELIRLKQETSNYLLSLAEQKETLESIKIYCNKQLEPKDPKQKSVIRFVGRLLIEEDYWEDFIQKFNKTDPFFSQNLLAKHPQLSANEIRLATLLRFGLDNKTIAHLLNISGEGIKKNRYRLRKKMGLKKEVVLEKYLLQL